MSEEILVWLHDIRVAILEIEGFYASSSKSFQEFNTNVMLRKAVERNFILVGEAVNRVLEKDQNFPISNARKIVGFRNRIAHEYDKLDNETIYNITIIYLPKLLEEVSSILDQNKP